MKKRSVNINGHATSLTLEDPFWEALKDIAAQQKSSVTALIAAIDKENGAESVNLSSAVRVYILKYLQQKNAQQ